MHTALEQNEFLSLSGKWSFQLDPEKKGLDERWFDRNLASSIKLPGTTDEHEFGTANRLKPALSKEVLHHLTRKHSYIGPAWYQKVIEIPKEWDGKKVLLSLERVIWETQVFLDGNQIGMRNTLSVPHVYDLSEYATPGKHVLTVMVDNSQKYNVGQMCHAYSDETQTIWNGIIGRICLRAIDKVHISDVQVYPKPSRKKARVKIEISNSYQKSVAGKLKVKAVGISGDDEIAETTESFKTDQSTDIIHIDYDMGENALLWDEFEPNLYELNVSLESENKGQFSDLKKVTFGLRDFITDDKHIKINGKKTFLRGTLECCIFPMTGYPPMELDDWSKIYETVKDHGLNHVRFHSWCPPEAAFQAADIAGVYLQIELPVWTYDIGKDVRRDDFLIAEADRIVDSYGNHPSFCMLSMGNELEGDYNFLYRLVNHLKNRDTRHIYTSTTFSFQDGHGKWPEPVDDFFISQQTKNGWIRGQGFFNEIEPNTNFDFRESLKDVKVPVISHEIGQYAVYPNLSEIPKYKGVLEPLNFKAVKQDLEEKNLLDKAADFTFASGKLAALLYKEDIELSRRTSGLSGYQLLDLHDFPGQSTALVGLLDAFWDSKGIVTARDFKSFSGPAAPILRMEKRVFTNNENFVGKAELSHYGPAKNIDTVEWVVRDSKKQIISKGQFENKSLSEENNIELGEIRLDLSELDHAEELEIEIFVPDSDINNKWNIWVYPDVSADEKDITISQSYDDKVKQALDNGGKVLLFANAACLKKSIPGTFVPVFWSPVHFPDQPGTMGLLIDSQHPALSAFPTKNHSDWQWWDLTKNSVSMIIDDLPQELDPIVQVVDNFARNHKLGNLLEARVGNGKLMICSIDLRNNIEKRPAAKQLLKSIIDYMKSDDFKPAVSLEEKYLNDLFYKSGEKKS